MGNSTTRGVRKLMSPVTKAFYGNTTEDDGSCSSDIGNDALCKRFCAAASPFVLTRTSSMYFDEDGDLAHEFYEETAGKSRRRTHMKRIYRNLTPQGVIEYDIPKLHPNIPTVIYQVT
ncbi:tumor suppressor candidate 2-like [Ptychodera flava]|uniref:tumor suppressor candidate 2-like n=1 Tax=Ptychodera flava TaxID=63121 RepID=UPI00396A1107